MYHQVTKEDRDWYVDFIEQYSQFLSRCNWYTFNPVFIEFEDDRIMGGVEFTFVIMGIGFRWRWIYTETPKMKELKRMIEDIHNEHD